MPIHRIPLTLTTRTGVHCALGDDPVDDVIVTHLHGRDGTLYFPPLPLGEPAGIVVDVGAHHGFYAVEALRRYPRCDVIAIEPDPQACRTIEANARLNGVASRIEVVCAGLANVDGRGWLVRDASGSWGHRTLPIESSADNLPATDLRTEITLKTLEVILAGRRPVIVKCNAEGAEFALVPQLMTLSHKPSVIVLMIHPEAGTARDLLDLLVDAGYRVADADTPPRGARFHCFLESASQRALSCCR